MRAAIGLVGILVAVGVLVYFLGKGGGLDYVHTVTKTGQRAQEEIKPLSAPGVRDFKDSVALDASMVGGKTVALIVTDIKTGGPAETFYGLKRDDAITQVGELTVKDQITSADDGIDYLTDAYQRKQPIIVVRNDKTITLPSAAVPAPTANAPATPPQSRDDRSSLQRQLDNITEAGSKPKGN